MRDPTKATFSVFLVLTLLGMLFSASAPAVHAAGPTPPEQKSGKMTIGVVHITFEPTFFFQSIQYQSFGRSYRQQLRRLSEERDFNLIQVEGGLTGAEGGGAVRRLIDLNVDAILYFQHEPDAAILPVEIAREAGIPIAIHGLRPAKQVQVPYVGFAEYETCARLGRETARLFQQKFPGEQANIMIVNSPTVLSDRLREQGFIDGFLEVIPEARIVARPPDSGVVESTINLVYTELLANPEINVIYNTTDPRAMGTMQALESLGRGTVETEIVAGVGGSEFAMREILDESSSWQAEVGLAIRNVAVESYQVLLQMVEGDLPVQEKKEVLVPSPVFVNPSLQEAREYLRVKHGIEEFNP